MTSYGKDTVRSQTCCFTGHRELLPSRCGESTHRLEQTVLALIRDGVRYFGAGGARGFDTLAAQTIIKLRKEYPHI